MVDTPAPKQRTGVDDARDRGRQALERIGAVKSGATLTGWQEPAIVALGDVEKPGVPRAVLDFVLAQGVTKAVDDHTDKMARLARTLNCLTGALVAATLLLVAATLLLVFFGK